MPLVSVVTASYDHARFLPDRIRSIREQTLGDFEWVIVDDCSSDDSYRILQEAAADDSRIKLFTNSRNLGMASTTRLAIQRSSGKYVYRAESDDVCEPDFLRRLVEALESKPRIGLAYCKCLQVDECGRVWGGSRQKGADRTWAGAELFASLTKGNFVSGSGTLFSRTAHDAVGGFGVGPFQTACDWHFHLRLSLSYDVIYVSEPLAYHRVHKHNLDSRAGDSFDLETIFRETYGVLSDVFGKVGIGQLRSLRSGAIRQVTLGPVAGLYAEAMVRRRHDIARQILKRVRLWDPDFRVNWEWASACIRAFSRRRLRCIASSIARGLARRRLWATE